jgi:hypothetical protein
MTINGDGGVLLPLSVRLDDMDRRHRANCVMGRNRQAQSRALQELYERPMLPASG